jgi:hypothetical protein
MGKYPCQDLHGGLPPFVNQSVDEYGMCNHEECNPENDDRKSDTGQIQVEDMEWGM